MTIWQGLKVGLASVLLIGLPGCSSTPSDTGWFRNREYNYLHQSNRSIADLKLPAGVKAPKTQAVLVLPPGSNHYRPTNQLDLTPPNYNTQVAIPKALPRSAKKGSGIQSTLEFNAQHAGLLTVMLPYAKAFKVIQKALIASGYPIKQQSVKKGLIELSALSHQNIDGLYLLEKKFSHSGGGGGSEPQNHRR